MKVTVTNKGKQETFEVDCDVQEAFEKLGTATARMERQFMTSIDLILDKEESEVTLLCDDVNPMLAEFMLDICKRELKSLKKTA